MTTSAITKTQIDTCARMCDKHHHVNMKHGWLAIKYMVPHIPIAMGITFDTLLEFVHESSVAYCNSIDLM